MIKICVVTGTRAEYGILKPLMYRICDDNECDLKLVATGMHLSPEFGLTYQEIEKDGFFISEKNEMLLSSDTPSGIVKSVGLGVIGFADIWRRVNPDIVVLLGDRYEIFAAAQSAMICRIPIAHIHGGELTEGAVDDAIRHSITKMSQLHFASTQEYRNRIIQMGEHPDRVFCVGSLGVENILKQKLLTICELEKQINFKLDKPFVIVTYHPVTLEDDPLAQNFKNLLQALAEMKEYKIIFTKANSDADGRIINQLIDEYVSIHNENSAAYASLGMLRYLSALKYCDIVIGNSSSGIIEAPSFHIPTVNIGNRQKGRIKADTVIDCGNEKIQILQAIEQAEKMKKEFAKHRVKNPYEGTGPSKEILTVIKSYLNGNKLTMKKKFYDMEFYNESM